MDPKDVVLHMAYASQIFQKISNYADNLQYRIGKIQTR